MYQNCSYVSKTRRYMCNINSLDDTSWMVKDSRFHLHPIIVSVSKFVFRTPRGERRHYISKGCDTRDSCTRRTYLYELMMILILFFIWSMTLVLYGLATVCTRNWYEDWACVECCQGDRCNRYVVVKSMKFIIFRFLYSIYFLARLKSSSYINNVTFNDDFIRIPYEVNVSFQKNFHLFFFCIFR